MLSFIGGTGAQGFGLALRFAYAGESIIIGSRRYEKAEKAANRIKSIIEAHGREARIEGVENKEAAEKGDIIFLTIPYKHCCSTIKELENEIGDKILVDVTNPLWDFMQAVKISASEEIQSLLENAKVVCAFKTISSVLLRDLNKDIEAHSFVCSNYEEAKKKVIELSDKIKIKSIDAGELKNAVIIERLTTFLIYLNRKYNIESGIKLVNGI